MKKIGWVAALIVSTLLAYIGAVHAQVPGCQLVPSCVAIQGFTPSGLASLSASTVSSRVALPASGTNLGLLLTNSGTVPAFYKLGDSSVTATTGDQPIPAGRSVAVPQGFSTYIAAVTGSGTAPLAIVAGAGMPTVFYSDTGGTPGGSGGLDTGTFAASFAASVQTLPSRASRIANVLDDCPGMPAPDGATDEAPALNACLSLFRRIYFPDSPGSGANITAALSGNAVSSSFSVVSGGSKYYGTPTLQIVGGQGTGASIQVFLNRSTFTIDTTQGTGSGGGYTITNGGSGYLSGTTSVVFKGGCSAAPTATLTVTSGVVTALTWGTLGTGCFTMPNVSVNPGVLAVATPTVVNGAITGVTLNNSPTGYTSVPTVTVTPGPVVYTGSSALVIHTGTELFGGGRGMTTYKLLPGANSDVIQCANFYKMSAGGTYDTQYGETTDDIYIHDITLDGGAGTFGAWSGTQQTGSIDREHGIACYGYHHLLSNLRVQNVTGRGIDLQFRSIGSNGRFDLGHSRLYNVEIQSTGLGGLLLGTHDSEAHGITVTNACQSQDDIFNGIDAFPSTRWSDIHPANTGTPNRCAFQFNAASGGIQAELLQIEGGRRDAIFGANSQVNNSTFFAAFPSVAEQGLGMVLVTGNATVFVNPRFNNSTGVPVSCVELGQGALTATNTQIIGGVWGGCAVTTPVDMTSSTGNDFIQGNATALLTANPAWSNWVTGGTVTFPAGNNGVLNGGQFTIAAQTVSMPPATSAIGSPAEIAARAAVTSLSVVASNGTDAIVGCPSTLAANSFVIATPTTNTWTCAAPVTAPLVGPAPASSLAPTSTYDFYQSTDIYELNQYGSGSGAPFNIVSPIAYGSVAYTDASSVATCPVSGSTGAGGCWNTNTGTVAAWTTPLPAGTLDHQSFVNCTNGTISALTVTPPTGQTVINAASSLGPFTCQEYSFRIANLSWIGLQVTVSQNAPAAFTTLTHGINVWSAVQRAAPANGATLSVSASTSLLLLNPGGTLATLTLSLPTPTVAYTELPVVCEQTITSLSFTGATVAGGPSTCSAASPFTLLWDATTSQYVRKG